MTMQVDDFKKLVETLDLPEDVKNKVLEAAGKDNKVPYEWKDETHLGAEIESELGNKYILYSVDDSMDFNAIAVLSNGDIRQGNSTYVDRRDNSTFTGRKAIMVDTRLPESVDDIEVGELFTARVDGEDVIVQRKDGNAFLWNVIDPSSHVYPEVDHNVQLIHRLVEAK